MSENEKRDILGAELDEGQLDTTSGGRKLSDVCGSNSAKVENEKDFNHCVSFHARPQGDCAATVEKGSVCSTNDACMVDAIDYVGCWCANRD